MAHALGIPLLLGLMWTTVSQGPWASAEEAGDTVSDIPTVQYETKEVYRPGPIGFMFRMTCLFIHMVLPQPFPEDTLRQVIEKKFDFASDQRSPESVFLMVQIIAYELGVIICAVLGLLFVILMPLVGFFFGLCRCCNKCGGEMHQRQKKSGPCLRKYFAVSLLVLCILISLGVIFGFMASQHQTTRIRGTRELARSNFQDMKSLLNTTSEQIKYLLNEYDTTKMRAFSHLDGIKSLLGNRILEQLKPRVVPVMDGLQDVAEAIKKTKETLVHVNKSVETLKTSAAQLSISLQEIRGSLEKTLSVPECTQEPAAKTCDNIRNSLSQLEVKPKLDQLPSLDKQIQSVDDILQTDLSSLVQKGNKTFNDIPQKVEDQARNVVSDTKKTLISIGSSIYKIHDQIPIEEKLSEIMKSINKSESYINSHLPSVQKYDSYRWLGSLLICSLLSLIVVFYLLGLLCGTIGYSHGATPTRRGFVSNTGGVFLMVGVGISFLFCWIFMALVVLTFVVGGNLEKLVCEPYQNRKLFRVLDTPYLLNKNWEFYLSGMILNKSDVNLTFEQVYSDCKEDRGLYNTLKLENIYNISEELSMEKHIESIHQDLDQLTVNVGRITLLDDAGRQNLLNFSNLDVDKIDFSAFLAETSKAPVKVNLLLYANGLEDKTNSLPQGDLRTLLKNDIKTIRKIYQNQVKSMAQQMSSIYQTVEAFQQETSDLGERVNGILSSLNSTQDFLTNHISTVITEEIKNYGDVLVEYFEDYLTWVDISITYRVASCKPFATALDSTIQVFFCSFIVDPMNLFWFGIGKATFLLLPALIFAVKLAKYYRRMDSEDVYDDMRNRNFGLHKHYPKLTV
ncbi:prominin-1 isoform X1 [Erinaceus europaeus]|uniref:Prominin-1 isoform X1 n=1 Tax=Erinaceus europaeus TaxID=9365 RepID=A0A1S3W612_ERIEU|nr:prominin-1 isoform X1 [Erinaceus europaeus]XP_060044285.1 prominin-1 isoform X1 [Erinaceus europaeus]